MLRTPTFLTALLFLVTFSFQPAIALAISDAEAQEAQAAEKTQKKEKVTSSHNVTLDFKDADILNVLRIISLKSGVNIVAGPDVRGPVTIRLTDVPWERALEVVLRTQSYAYERDGNIIRVTTLENLEQEAVETEVFLLTYAQALDAEVTLTEMLSPRGSIRADRRTNTLIVTDVPTNVYKISRVMQQLDRGTPQVLIEAKIMEMSVSEAEQIGVRWNASVDIRGSSRPTTFPWDTTRSHENFFRFFPRGKPAGSVIPIADDGTISSSSVITAPEDFPLVTRTNRAALAKPFPFASPTDFTFGKIDFGNFQVLLEAIENSGNNKVLSEPRITVLSNHEARILVGEELYIPNYERNEETGKMEITGYIPRSLGIELIVLPQINHKNQVNVLLAPSISSLIGFEELTPDVSVPRISVRNASTRVRVNSGDTIVLGGLIQENIVDDVTKFPILGDLPIFEHLFKHTDKKVVKTDLTFFVTVTVLDEPDVVSVYDDADRS